MISKACEYAIKSCIYLADQSMAEKKSSFEKIAEKIQAPAAFTGKILQLLTKHNLLQSQKGPNGGYFFNKNQLNRISIADIIEIVDGNKLLNNCILRLEKCNAKNPCALHDDYAPIRQQLNKSFSLNTLNVLINKNKK